MLGRSPPSGASSHRGNGEITSSWTGFYFRRQGQMAYKRVKKAVSRKKRSAQAALIDMTTPIQRKVMTGVKEILKDALANDPGMCSMLQQGIRHVVDDLWQDVEFEVGAVAKDCKHSVKAGAHAWKTVEKLRAVGPEPRPWSFKAFRAWFLYYSLPFDKSIFGCLVEWRFWVFLVWSMIPDLRVAYYGLLLILFIVPGPADEHQLVQFIVQTKATQFLSSGIGLAFVGGMQYYMCVGEHRHTCAQHGPGSSTTALMGAIDIIGTSSLVWLSFLMLPYSRRAEGESVRMEALYADEEREDEERHEDTSSDDDEHDCLSCWMRGREDRRYDQKRGGRLTSLLKYDLWCFVIATAFLFGISAKHIHNSRVDVGFLEHTRSWTFRTTLYWTRVFYSFLALPFVVFSIPVLTSILTHTLRTGYNRNGIIVESMLPPMDEDDLAQQSPSRASSLISGRWQRSDGGVHAT